MDGHPSGFPQGAGGQNPAYRPAHRHPPTRAQGGADSPPTLLQQQLDGGRAARAYLHVGVRTWGQPLRAPGSGTKCKEHDGSRTEYTTQHLKTGHPLPQELPGQGDRDSRAERYEGRHHCG